MRVDHVGEAAQQACAVGGGGRGPGGLRGVRPGDRTVHVSRVGGRDDGDDLLGGRVEYGQLVRGLLVWRLLVRRLLGGTVVRGPLVRVGQGGTFHRRSKERRSSQSVTAASKASSSTRAMLR